MKKHLFLVAAFLAFPFFASAQAGPQVLVGQGIVDHTFNMAGSAYPSNFTATWTYTLGTGLTGTTTTAYLYGTYGSQTSSQNYPAILFLYSFADSQYSTATSTCAQFFVNYPSGNPFPAQDGYIQLNPTNGTGCVMNPHAYYKAQIQFSNGINPSGPTFPMVIRGVDYSTKNYSIEYGTDVASTSRPFFPMFSLDGGSWTLIATSSASSFSLSGAQAFCNDAFASSTGIGASLGNGLCVSLGFLFIPSSNAVDDFVGIPLQIAQTFPFSWLVQMRSLLEASTASTSDSFVSVESNFGTTTGHGGFYVQNLYLVSTSSMARFFPDSLRNTFKTVLGVGFWMLGALFLYRKLNNVWHTT